MFPKLKKKSEVVAPLVPAWHPNFRNFERLPDVKVVRTAFYTNGISIVVVLMMMFWLGYREYQLHDLNRQVADWQGRIDRDRKASTLAVAQYKKFQTEAARVAEIETFIKSKPIFSEMLLRLTETLPAAVALEELDMLEAGFNLRGTVRGTPDIASGHASAYLQLLQADAVFLEKFSEITLPGLTPNPQSGRLQFDIKFKLKEAKKP